MRLVCIGDSLTYGFGVRRAEIFTALLADACPGMEVLNKGRNGDTTGGILARFERDALGESPNLIFLMGGSNDIFFGRDLAAVKSNISTMTFWCMQNRVKLLLGIPFPVYQRGLDDRWRLYAGGETVQGLLAEYGDWLTEFGRHFGIPVADLRTCISGFGEQAGKLYLDGVHLSAAGHQRAAEFLVKKLSEMEK